jgi:hypothetical protein
MNELSIGSGAPVFVWGDEVFAFDAAEVVLMWLRTGENDYIFTFR